MAELTMKKLTRETATSGSKSSSFGGRARSVRIDQPRTADARTFDIEGQSVRCIETDDGKRTWLCVCADFQERAARHPKGFCAHTAFAIWRCIEDG